MKTRTSSILILILVLIPIPSAYSSCASWIPGVSDVRAYSEASAVFVGTVIEANEPSKKGTEGSPYSEYATFAILYMLKGDLEDNKVVTNPKSSIGYNDFVVGGAYLVYAYGPNNSVNICTAPQIFPMFLPILMLHFPFLLVPIGIIGGLIVWRIKK